MAYSDLLIWQYKGKPKAVATATLFDRLIQPTWDGFQDIPTTYDIDRATGVSLDIIGRIVGVTRTLPQAVPRQFFGFNEDAAEGDYQNPNAGPFMRGQIAGGRWYRYGGAIADSSVASDEEMRTLIRMKVIKNYQTGSIPNLLQSLIVLLGGVFASAVDNLDMTVTVYIVSSRVTPFVQYVLDQMDLLPRAAGVRLVFDLSFDFDPSLLLDIHTTINITLPRVTQRIEDYANANIPSNAAG